MIDALPKSLGQGDPWRQSIIERIRERWKRVGAIAGYASPSCSREELWMATKHAEARLDELEKERERRLEHYRKTWALAKAQNPPHVLRFTKPWAVG